MAKARATVENVFAMSPVISPDAIRPIIAPAISDGGIIVRSLMMPDRQSASSNPTPDDRDRDARAHDGGATGHVRFIARSDSARSEDHRRAVTTPNAGSATMRLSRSRGQAGGHDVDEAAGARRHHADAVGQHRRLVEGVGDEQHGGPGLAPQAQEFVAHEQAGLLVQRAERLIEQDQARLGDQRAGDADPLAHPARELRRIGVRRTP